MQDTKRAAPPWYGDLSLWVVLAATTAVRALPLAIWPSLPPIRDEASYVFLAQRLLGGEGIVPTAHGWLWAPLYPALLAVHGLVFGSVLSIRVTQVLLSPLAALLVYRLGTRLGGRRTGLIAGALYALEPTLAAFSLYLWTEHVYTVFLLLAIEAALWARSRIPAAALVPGIALGLAMLTRGVGTFALPFLLPALLWGKLRDARAWARCGVLALGAALLVVPYSVYATRKFGGFVLVDTSIGFNMWLGNNDFAPVSFDYQMGGDTLSEDDYRRLGGRGECWEGMPPPEKNACEIGRGLGFIREKPGLFLERIWMREAQTFNPASFLLRNLRWGRYEGMPAGLVSLLCLLVLAAHFLILWLAVPGAAVAPGLATDDTSGPFRAAAWTLTLYHLAAAGALIGLSRFRLPLIPIWIPFAALTLAAPGAVLQSLRARPSRALLAAALFALVTALSLVYLGRAFPA